MQLKPQFRDFHVKAVDKENKTIELSFSSEVPYERYWGVEILDHSSTSVNMKRLNNDAPLLFNHDRDIVIGVVENARIEENRGKATVRFGNSAKALEVFRDVEDGILKNVSVGYEIHEMAKESEKDGVETYRVTNWQPLEISIVSIPADNTVGVGRDKDLELKEIKIKKVEEMKEEVKKIETQEIDVKAIQEEARKSEVERVREINAIGEKFDKKELASKAIEDGVALNEFRANILSEIKMGNEIMTKSVEIGMTEKDRKDYSFARALKASITGDWTGAELERDASDAVGKMLGNSARGFYVPMDVLSRDIDTTAGASIVSTDNMAGSFIEMLRNKSVVINLGARTLTGLSGNVTIPKQVGSANTAWIDENGVAVGADLTLSSIGLSPKTISGKTGYSRQMLLQGNPSIENLVMSDLAQSIALGIDKAAIAGTGAAGQPTGILTTTGIGSVSMATAAGGSSFAKVVEMETTVKADNADINTMKYLTNASTAGTLKTTEKAAGYPQYILENGKMNGYDCAVSNQVAANTIVFGDFSQLVVAMWGGLDVVVNRSNDNGGYTISAFQSVDFGVRHSESFAATVDVNQ